MAINPNQILEELEHYDINIVSHSKQLLTDHLVGTFNILKDWDSDQHLCLAGLCHSVYGTESFQKQSVPIQDREKLVDIIGAEAEELVYLFGCHSKKTFWMNLKRTKSFEIDDRFTNEKIFISEDTFKKMVTLTLANWLEQRPRAPKEYWFVRKEEFLNSEKLLPKIAFETFLTAYGLK